MIDWLFHNLFGDRRIKTDFKQLTNIWDIPKAESEIRLLFRIVSKYGPTDHLEMVFADAVSPGEAPFSVMYNPNESRLKCAIALNAKLREFFAVLPKRQRFSRMMWLLQAYFITLDARGAVEAGDSPSVVFTSSPSPEVTVSSMVVQGRARYSIEKSINRALIENFSGPDGSPVTLAGLYEQEIDLPVRDQILTRLDTLEDTISRQIESVVSGRYRDEMSVWLSCSGLLWELLSKLAGLAAAFDDSSDWQSQINRLDANRVFAYYISDAWPVLHADWRAAQLVERRQRMKASPDAKASIKGIFERLGIRILDSPQGASILQFGAPTR